MRTRAVFLDRDGVVNEDPADNYYVRSWEEFRFQRGIFEAIRRLRGNGFRIFVVSNQSGVARGVVRPEDLEEITRRMEEELTKNGAAVDGVFYCVHDDDDACPCRKPKSGLLHKAVRGLRVDRRKSFMVGDSERDLRAGRDFGCRTVLTLTGKTSRADAERFRARPDHIAATLGETVDWILLQSGRGSGRPGKEGV